MIREEGRRGRGNPSEDVLGEEKKKMYIQEKEKENVPGSFKISIIFFFFFKVTFSSLRVKSAWPVVVTIGFQGQTMPCPHCSYLKCAQFYFYPVAAEIIQPSGEEVSAFLFFS